MPRPKPLSPIRVRQIRLSDDQWEKLKELGGPAWLRRLLDDKPEGYHRVFKHDALEDTDSDNNKRTRT